MKVYTCAPEPFPTDERLFARDAGLLCRALQQIGHSTKLVLPARERAGEEPPDLIRASRAQLEDSAWWRDLSIEWLVVVGWGFSPHTPMLRAARRAQVKVCLILDSNGVAFPFPHFREGVAASWRKSENVENLLMRPFSTAARVTYFGVKFFFQVCLSKYQQMKEVDLLVFQTPQSLYGHCELIRAFGSNPAHFPMVMLGYPIPDQFATSQKTKPDKSPRKLIAVGRWDAVTVKRPHKLMEIVHLLLAADPRASVDIFGLAPAFLASWWEGLPAAMRARIILHGVHPPPAVLGAMCAAQVLLTTSPAEGLPLVALEALCAGCTVTGLDSATLPALRWAAIEGDATLAKDDRAASYVNAILIEFDQWEMGRRDGVAISRKWCSRLLAHNFAHNLVTRLATQ